jgi:hypothetical protein
VLLKHHASQGFAAAARDAIDTIATDYQNKGPQLRMSTPLRQSRQWLDG